MGGITILPKNRRNQDGFGNPFSSYEDEEGKYSINIHDADVHNVYINNHFTVYDTATENPSSAISIGDTVINVASTTGFSQFDDVVLKDALGDTYEHHFRIVAIVVDTSITVNRPINRAYSTSATIELVNLNMNVVGSLAAPITFTVAPPSTQTWHITQIVFSLLDQTAMDDSLFGGLTALVNGVVLTENRTVKNTLAYWRTNGMMAQDMYELEYAAKAPAGYYGLRGRLALKTTASAVMRLDGSLGDSLDILIQDDLSGLDSFTAHAHGHIE